MTVVSFRPTRVEYKFRDISSSHVVPYEHSPAEKGVERSLLTQAQVSVSAAVGQMCLCDSAVWLLQTRDLLFFMWCLQSRDRKAALSAYLNINSGKAHSKHMSDIRHKPAGGNQAGSTCTCSRYRRNL